MSIRTDAVDHYFDELRPQRSAVMAEMEALADRDSVPIVSWETGRLLSALAAASDGRVLEVGTAIGYSALHMAEALEAGSITTLKREPDRIAQARDYLELAEPLLAPRAVLAVDNVLMSGQVAEPAAGGRWSDDAVQGQRAFNEAVVGGGGWRASVLPVGDGVLVASR